MTPVECPDGHAGREALVAVPSAAPIAARDTGRAMSQEKAGPTHGQFGVAGADAADVKEVAKDKLGGLRLLLGGELRAVPDLLVPSERILTMALATSGRKGQLLVVTNRGLLFIHQFAPLFSVRCSRYGYGEITSLQAVEKPTGTGLFRVDFTHGGEQQSWGVQPPIRGPEIAGIAGLATARGSLES
jgi:hypothetical protein